VTADVTYHLKISKNVCSAGDVLYEGGHQKAMENWTECTNAIENENRALGTAGT
jgi:hypothetical protein